jgi:hypothetical protein
MVKAGSDRWSNNSNDAKLLDSLRKNHELAPGAAASRLRQLNPDLFGKYSVLVFRKPFNNTLNRHSDVVRSAQAKQKPKGKVDCCDCNDCFCFFFDRSRNDQFTAQLLYLERITKLQYCYLYQVLTIYVRYTYLPILTEYNPP